MSIGKFFYLLIMILLPAVFHLSNTYHKIHIELMCLRISKAETHISEKEVMYIWCKLQFIRKCTVYVNVQSGSIAIETQRSKCTVRQLNNPLLESIY